MIPPPPFDRALPGLATAFDGEAMASLLGRRLPDCVSGRWRILACRPVYLRYKPGTQCFVRYEVCFKDLEGGDELATTLHVILYAEHAAPAVANRPSLARYVARAARHHPAGPPERSAWLPEINALAMLFPVDLRLTSLARVTSPRAMRRALPSALAAGEGSPTDLRRSAAVDVALVRYKPGRKALMRYSLAAGDAATSATAAVYFGKVYADPAAAARVDALGRVLAAAGAPTPSPAAFVPELNLLLHPEVQGTVLRAWRGQADFAAAMPPAVEALDAFHAAGARAIDQAMIGGLGRVDVLGSTAATSRLVASIAPQLAERVQRLGRALSSRLAGAGEARVLVHGDFYDDQLMVDGDGITVLDLDEAAIGDPRVDVANLLAHISVWEDGAMGWEVEGSGGAIDAARAAFIDAWAKGGARDLGDLAAYEAAALVNLSVAPFREMAEDWPCRMERRLALAEARLADDTFSIPQGPRRPAAGRRGPHLDALPLLDDPTLPQLGELLDRVRMAGVFEGLGETDSMVPGVLAPTVRVDRIAVVRHKPGRRCVIRYDVAVAETGGRREETWYGKTFASRRGARVHAVHSAIAGAGALGPGVRVAEPVAYVPALDLTLLRAVPGQPAAPALAAGATGLAERLADALHALHSSELALPRVHGLEAELAPLAERTRRLGERCPPLAAAAERCLAAVEDGPPGRAIWRRMPIHRDFYHDQVLVDARGTLAVLDFDDAAMSEPAVDVANFIAHLRLLGFQQPASSGAIAASSAAFLARYRALDAELDPRLLRFLEGATLLRLAEIHLPRPDGRRIAERLLAAGAQCLGGWSHATCAPVGATANLGKVRHGGVL
jgi:aminoglycoside phosphotransferase (APT) family kinase protein